MRLKFFSVTYVDGALGKKEKPRLIWSKSLQIEKRRDAVTCWEAYWKYTMDSKKCVWSVQGNVKIPESLWEF